jgi:sulfate permease, SulP family
MNLFRRITVALARAPADAELLRYAELIREKVAPEAAFQFVHVLPDAGSLSAAAAREIPTHGSALLSIRDRVNEHFSGSPECLVLNGSRVDRLLEHSAESGSDVILLGHRRARTGRRSLVRRLAMKAPCSLWLVPEGSALRIEKILVGIDFSPSSAEAMRLAALLARGARVRGCTAVHVVRPEERPAGEAAFDRFLGALDLSGTVVQRRTENGTSVTQALLDIAADEEADLIVMGTRGSSSSAAVLLGAEAEQMLRESRYSVLVTRRRGEHLGVLQVLLDRDLQAQ